MTGGFSSQKPSDVDLWCSFSEQTAEQTDELLWFQTPWRSCDVTVMTHYWNRTKQTITPVEVKQPRKIWVNVSTTGGYDTQYRTKRNNMRTNFMLYNVFERCCWIDRCLHEKKYVLVYSSYCIRRYVCRCFVHNSNVATWCVKFISFPHQWRHMSAKASQIIDHSTACSAQQNRKDKSKTLLVLLWGERKQTGDSPHKRPEMQRTFPALISLVPSDTYASVN